MSAPMPRAHYPYASASGLTARSNGVASASGEFAMDMPGPSYELDEEVAGLRSKVKLLKNMSNRIGEEATIRGELIDALTIDFSSSDAAMRDVRKKLERTYERAKSGHLMSLMFFALCAFFGMFVFVKFGRVIRVFVPKGTGQSVRHH